MAVHFLNHHIAVPFLFWVGILLATVTTTMIALYIYMFYTVRRMSVEQRNSNKTQMKLTLCAFFVAVFLALLSFLFCLFSFNADTITFGENAVYFFVSCELNTFCNVYLLLGTSSVVRHRVGLFAKRVFCCKTNEPQNNYHPAQLKGTARAVKRSNRAVVPSIPGVRQQTS